MISIPLLVGTTEKSPRKTGACALPIASPASSKVRENRMGASFSVRRVPVEICGATGDVVPTQSIIDLCSGIRSTPKLAGPNDDPGRPYRSRLTRRGLRSTRITSGKYGSVARGQRTYLEKPPPHPSATVPI